MNTSAPAQKRQYNATAPQASAEGKQRPAGVGLPLFIQAKSWASAAGVTLQRQCSVPKVRYRDRGSGIRPFKMASIVATVEFA